MSDEAFYDYSSETDLTLRIPMEVYADLSERAMIHCDGDVERMAVRLIMLGLGWLFEEEANGKKENDQSD